MSKPTLVLLLTGLLSAGQVGLARADEPLSSDPWIRANLDDLVGLYKHLHSHPELSFREVETSRRIAEELKKAGAEVTTGVGKFGVVGLLKNGRGPTILVRSDLDALPVKEETGLPYASREVVTDAAGKSVGVMHACGHDVHMTCLVGTARWLASHRDRWAGTVVLVGQPAEELIGGAKGMLDDGLYERFPKPDAALALHVTSDQPVGAVGYRSGPALAGSTAVTLTIRGKGGHGAAPQTTVDPIVLAALVIVDLQTIASREVNPVHPCVVTVGSIHGGTKSNIIPNDVRLELSLRYYSDEVRDQLLDGIRRRIKGLAQAHRAPEPVFEVFESTPPTVNTPELVDRVVPVLRKALGANNVVLVDPVMGAEDFGLFGRGGVPTFMFRVGTLPPGRAEEAKAKKEVLPSLHSATFAPEPPGSIATGIRAMTAAVVGLMGPGQTRP
jgi:hippurate hydrolase